MHIILISLAIFAHRPVVSPPAMAFVPKVADPCSIEFIDLCLCAAEVMLYRRTREVRFPVSDAFSGFAISYLAQISYWLPQCMLKKSAGFKSS